MASIRQVADGITNESALYAIVRLLLFAGLLVGPCLMRAHAARDSATTRDFEASVGEIVTAMTNAFASHNYHNMLLSPIPCQYDAIKRRWIDKPATNEWELYSNLLPLGVITKGGKSLPYFAHFEIRLDQETTNRCKVTVRTISSFVHNGKEIGVHGGWAWGAKNVAPVLQEETNVLARIDSQLQRIQSGDLRPLPPTPDTKDAAEYPVKRLMELNPYSMEWRRLRADTMGRFGLQCVYRAPRPHPPPACPSRCGDLAGSGRCFGVLPISAV